MTTDLASQHAEIVTWSASRVAQLWSRDGKCPEWVWAASLLWNTTEEVGL